MYTVYALVDPRNASVYYVGVTQDVYRRFSEHLSCSDKNTEKNRWIEECIQSQIVIVMETLEHFDDAEKAYAREKYWIQHFLDLNMPLTNYRKIVVQKPTPMYQPKPLQPKANKEIPIEARLAWDNGAKGPRALERVLGINYHQAHNIYLKLRESDQSTA